MESVKTFGRRSELPSFSPSKKSVLDDIMQEYCLKRNRFDPRKPSPNKFVSKLQYRMKEYYKNLSSSPNKY